jgi:FYVE/RhoGEF/PH domain-containing protein 5/6
LTASRIPRYILLLKELLKNTEKTHSDYDNLDKAIKSFEGVATMLNKNKELTENLDKVLKIEKEMKLEHELSRK